MAIRNIVVEGDPILRKKCRPVDEVNDRIRGILDDMYDTMVEQNGVGIAAPQVGIMRRMFIAQPDPESDIVFYMINPEIIEMSGSQQSQEGCLSVPGYIGTVDRPTYVKLKALDYDGNEQIIEAEGFDATVMCHEYDHLDGILYIDKAVDVHKPEDFEEDYE